MDTSSERNLIFHVFRALAEFESALPQEA